MDASPSGIGSRVAHFHSAVRSPDKMPIGWGSRVGQIDGSILGRALRRARVNPWKSPHFSNRFWPSDRNLAENHQDKLSRIWYLARHNYAGSFPKARADESLGRIQDMIIRNTVLAVSFAALAIACGGSQAPAEAPEGAAAAEEAPAAEAPAAEAPAAEAPAAEAPAADAAAPAADAAAPAADAAAK
jgi:hypothetical protein